MMREIIADNLSVPAGTRMAMTNLLGIYDEFICKGNLQEAIKLAEGNDKLKQCFEAVAYLQQGNFDQAFKTFSSALRGTRQKLLNEEIFDFYYAVSLAYSTQSSAKIKIEALQKEEDAYFGLQPSVLIILKIAKGKKNSISVQQAFSASISPISTALTLLAIEHYKIDDQESFAPAHGTPSFSTRPIRSRTRRRRCQRRLCNCAPTSDCC